MNKKLKKISLNKRTITQLANVQRQFLVAGGKNDSAVPISRNDTCLCAPTFWKNCETQITAA
ncbi:MAG: hypothetical protein JNM68_01055 [Dinghuibacter sp.]|nr:hypothetical protein [Dinghuibacter sp.]